jgi:SSS family solute:Na+ symporter
MYGARTEASAKWSMCTAGIIEIVFSVAVGITGMYAYLLNPNIEAQDQALPWLVTHVLPMWLAAIVVVSVTAAVFSSGDSNAAAAGTYFVRHIYPLVTGRYPKRPLAVIRRALVGAFLISTVLALYAGNIVDFVVDFLSVTMSGLAVIILLGRFWKRATWQGGVAALTSAPIVSLVVIFVPGQAELWVEPIIPATLAGLVAHVVVSLMTPANKLGFEEVTSVMMKQRRAIDD